MNEEKVIQVKGNYNWSIVGETLIRQKNGTTET
ncbi:hypothetical protein JOC73_000260 [Alkaliphilus hydrothermalis]|uniref:Uncharacterized protein n=1 Tax=Alkaliphilus hydrothermalis TaxID=1482730 RepID=A0ABS2NLG9_9FIRM|nr:hypothetical protein [Alkaliphilus hydrothermalis]